MCEYKYITSKIKRFSVVIFGNNKWKFRIFFFVVQYLLLSDRTSPPSPPPFCIQKYDFSKNRAKTCVFFFTFSQIFSHRVTIYYYFLSQTLICLFHQPFFHSFLLHIYILNSIFDLNTLYMFWYINGHTSLFFNMYLNPYYIFS